MEIQKNDYWNINIQDWNTKIEENQKSIKSKIIWLVSNFNLEKRLKYLEKLLIQKEKENQKNIKLLIQKFKDKNISAEDFKNERYKEELKIQEIIDKINQIKEELIYREIILNNSKVKKSKKILKLEQNFWNYIWKNIMNWWSNAFWVYEINWENLVLIEKSIWSFKFLWNLTIYYQKIKNSQNIPKVYSVFIKNSKTYLIMEKANWIQLDNLSTKEIEDIPQKHFDDFIKNLKKINEAWLCIDPSKTSNFFYDEKIWFIFIDLQPWLNNLSYYNLEKIFLSSILWKTYNVSEKILEKIKNAIKN